MKILIFGFSVTGEKEGYVERWQELFGRARPECKIVKVGLGGVQPDHARHLLPGLVRTHRPDAVILEFATASYRARDSSDYRRSDQRATVLSLFQICKEQEMTCGMLDLPLQGVNADDDWVVETDKKYCDEYGVAMVTRAFDKGLLTDNVHPNDVGKTEYATSLNSLLEKMYATRPNLGRLHKVRRFDAFPIDTLTCTGSHLRPFSRHGFETPALELPAGIPVTVKLDMPVAVTGLISIMNPRSGNIKVDTGEKVHEIPSYDVYSYYERVIGRVFPKSVTDTLVFEQSADIPELVPLKGEKDYSARLGGITHILYEPLPQDLIDRYQKRPEP